jgi:hypothetical protein
MKQILLILPFFMLFSCGGSEKVRISGEIENGKDKTIYLDHIGIERIAVLDSAKIKSGNKFSFSSKIAEPSFYRLRLDSNNFITLLAEPGERMSIEASASNLSGTYRVSGSEGSELIRQLNERLTLTRNQMTPLIREIISLEEGPGFKEAEARINEELEDIIKAQRRYSIAFILDNIESLAAITALYQRLDDNYVLDQLRDLQYLKIVAESLKKKYPDSPHVKALAADAGNQERQYELLRLSVMAEQAGEVITTYPDIAMPGKNGDIINLHSLPQKYVLVLFGSSLNPQSVQFSHDLAPIYRAYHPKGFEVYHVSVERDRQEWLRNLEFSELPWIHVAEFGEGGFKAAQVYNVQQIPSNYLINRDAGVVARNLSPQEIRRRLARALD